MDPDDPMGDLRARTQDTIAANALALKTPPSVRPPEAQSPMATVGAAMVDGADGLLTHAEKALPAAANTADRMARGIGKFAAAGPGRVLSAVDVATARDKPRAMAGLIGGEIGGDLGALAPGFEWITVPAGAWLGNEAGKFVYDHRAQIGRALARGGAAMAQGPAW
jgi:hypothetical protein